MKTMLEAAKAAKTEITRLTPEQKNQALLIRAFALFHADHPEYTLSIYGEGELAEESLGIGIEGHLQNLQGIPNPIGIR